MIKQIAVYSCDRQTGVASITLYVLSQYDAEAHLSMLKELIAEGAVIESVDEDVIRASFENATQDKLRELLDAGWTFDGADPK